MPRAQQNHREDAPAAAARIERAVAGYGRAPVLRDLSLELRDSEIFVLLGPNGSGKSTLVRLLTGALRPTTGTVQVTGGARAVGVAPQEPALYSWLTARENVFAFARFEGLPSAIARERTRWALDIAECTGEADAPVGRLSGGYRKRVNIAAALVKQPKLLILDEPMAGVDLEARRAIGAAIRTVKARGMAVLLITHDFEEADLLADRAGVLVEGSLAAEGTPGELIHRAFGSATRLEIALAREPEAAGLKVLADEGAIRSGENWVLFRELEHWNARPVIARLAAGGLAIKETRLRQPGLESVYSRLVAGR